MTGQVGNAALAAGTLAALLSTGLCALGCTTGRKNGAPSGIIIGGFVAVAVFLVVATGAIGWALVRVDGSLVYVADHTQRGTAAPYRLAGLWGGLEGSLLLHTTLIALVFALCVSKLDNLGATISGLVVSGFCLTSWLTASPFTLLSIPAIDGGGLTPILEHPAMLVHPPLLYLATALTLVPFAGAVAAGLTGQPSAAFASARAQLLVSWILLTVALALGANWAYVELGWGGWWGWDPVENSGLLPWLAITAFLHPARHRGAHSVAGSTTDQDSRADSAELLETRVDPVRIGSAAAPFVLVVLGSYMTRSGASSSVHAFGESGAVGMALLTILAVAFMLATLATFKALPVSREPGGCVRGRVLVFQNLLVGYCLAVVLVGTTGPAVASGLGLAERTTGGEFYSRLLAPAGALTAALCLLVTLPVYRRMARLGSISAGPNIAHVGVLVIVLGVIGSTQSSEVTTPLGVGEKIEVAGYVFELRDVRARELEGPDQFGFEATGITATIAVKHGSQPVIVLRPELNALPARGTVLAETALHSRVDRDLQVAIRDARRDGSLLIQIGVRPLVTLVWWGATLLAAGGLVGLVRPRRQRASAIQPAGSR